MNKRDFIEALDEVNTKYELMLQLCMRNTLIPIEDIAAALNLQPNSVYKKYSKDIVKLEDSYGHLGRPMFLRAETVFKTFKKSEIEALTFINKHYTEFRKFIES